jgi:hypothetical protein
MLGEKAEAPMDGWGGISEGDTEKSTAKRLGLLSKQGLSDGKTGPADAMPGNWINKDLGEKPNNERLHDELDFDCTDPDATCGENTVCEDGVRDLRSQEGEPTWTTVCAGEPKLIGMVVGVFDNFGSVYVWVVPHDEMDETATGEIPPHGVAGPQELLDIV